MDVHSKSTSVQGVPFINSTFGRVLARAPFAAIMWPHCTLLPSPHWGPVPNGSTHVHLWSWRFTIAAAVHKTIGCPIHHSRRCLQVPPLWPQCTLLQSSLLPNNQSGILLQQCRLRGRPQGFKVPSKIGSEGNSGAYFYQTVEVYLSLVFLSWPIKELWWW